MNHSILSRAPASHGGLHSHLPTARSDTPPRALPPNPQSPPGSPTRPSPRGGPGFWAARGALLATLLGLSASAAPAFMDDFNDGNDDGWARYSPLATYGAPGTFTFPNGAYRIQFPAFSHPQLGAARGAAYRIDATYTDFALSVDVLDFSEASDTWFGLGARLGSIALGQSTGYYFHYYPAKKELHLDYLQNEATRNLAAVTNLVLTPTKDYRMVFRGQGAHLSAQLFELPNLSTPIALLQATDSRYASGFAGLLVAGLAGPADVTFDNYSASVLPFTDDFSAATDAGWLHYDVLKAVGGTPGTFEIVNGTYHLHAPPTPNAAYGPARVAGYRPEVYTDFTVAADFVGWDTTNRNQFGLLGRMNNLGLGRTGGYLFSFQTGELPTDNRLALYTVKGESGYTLADRYDVVLDPTHRYRMVMTGVGHTLVGELYDLANPNAPLATLTGYDWLHTSGHSGVLVLAYRPGGSGDLLVDNFQAGVGTGAGPSPLLPPEAPFRFLAEQAYKAGPGPGWIDQGDFNRDGFIDLAVPNNNGNNVSVFLNQGDGTLGPKTDYPAGAGSTFVKVADLNGNGVLDLVVANAKTNTVSVLLGNGDGTFKAKLDSAAGSKPYSIAAGDLNSDGRVDLVVANNNTNTLSVLLGNGDGSFAAPAAVVVGNLPHAVRLLDLNGDGKLDIAVATGGETNIGTLLGKGDGSFNPMVANATEIKPGDIQVGDFNADGRADVVTVNHDAERVMVLLSNGDGTLAAPRVMTGFNHGSTLAVADVNRDGKLDLVVGTDAISKVYILLGNNDGTFQEQMYPQRVAGGVIALTSADLNGDGFADVALANSVDERVQVLLADPAVMDSFADGNDAGWMHYDPLGGVGGKPVTFEVKDGAYHIRAPLSTNLPAAYGPPRAGAFYPTNAFHDFEVAADVLGWDNDAQTQWGLIGRANHLKLGQATGYSFTYLPINQKLEIIIIQGESGFLLAQQTFPLDPTRRYRAVFTGVAEYLTGTLYDLAQPEVPIAVLKTRDTSFTSGLCGLLIYTQKPGAEADATIDNYSAKVGTLSTVDLNVGPAPAFLFAHAGSSPAGNQAGWLAAGHLNGDTHIDLAVANSGAKSVSVLLGNGDGTFKPRLNLPTGTTPQGTVIRDFDGDQKADIAVANHASASVSVLRGNGDGTFNPKVDFTVGARPAALAAADLNHDQIPDLVSLNAGASAADAINLSVLLGAAGGTFAPKVDYPATSTNGSLNFPMLQIVDVNRDTHLDVVAGDGDGFGLWLGRGDGTLAPEVRTPLGALVSGLTSADFDGDGRVDLAVASFLAEQVEILRGNGDGTFSPHGTLSVPRAVTVIAVDLDGDGKLELAVESSPSYLDGQGHAWQRITVFRGLGNGRFQTPGTILRGSGFLWNMVAADLNGDQRPDLAVSNSVGFSVNVFLNQGLNPGAENRIELAWPTATRGFTPARAAELGGPWTDLGTAPHTGPGPVKAVEVDRTAAQQFFQLRKP